MPNFAFTATWDRPHGVAQAACRDHFCTQTSPQQLAAVTNVFLCSHSLQVDIPQMLQAVEVKQ